MTWDQVPAATGTNSIAMTASIATDTDNGVEYFFDCNTPGGHDSGWQSETYYEDTGLTESTTYTYYVTARDTSYNHNETLPSTAESATTDTDTVAPAPNPMTWAVVPTAGSTVPISLVGDETVTTTPNTNFGTETVQLAGLLNDPFAYDPANPTSPMPQTVWGANKFFAGMNTYIDTIAYDFDDAYYNIFVDLYGRSDSCCRQRDDSFDVEFYLAGVLQETVASGIDSTHHVRVTASPGTLADSIRIVETAVVPNAFTLAEIRVNSLMNTDTSISMIATTASDPSGVEYYFECIEDPAHDSDWQDSTVYTDTGLSPDTTYTYKVIAQDKSADQNETAASDEASATTDP
jgi:chitodextrinase